MYLCRQIVHESPKLSRGASDSLWTADCLDSDCAAAIDEGIESLRWTRTNDSTSNN